MFFARGIFIDFTTRNECKTIKTIKLVKADVRLMIVSVNGLGKVSVSEVLYNNYYLGRLFIVMWSILYLFVRCNDLVLIYELHANRAEIIQGA